MYRTFVILRHTFLESVIQPIYSLLLAIGAAVLIIFGMLPFFTLGEDTTMYKSVGLDVILLFVLLATLFATSKSIFDEIEDRTMLTLMSKPIQRWEVLVGKYLGIILAALLAVIALGAVFCLATWYRIPTDYLLRAGSLDDREINQIWSYRAMHISGLIPSLMLLWFQISTLAAIGVALSTRFSLVVNLPTVILLYIAGNLTRFLFPLNDPAGPLFDRSAVTKGFAWFISLLLPYLQTFDLRQKTVYGTIKVPNTMFMADLRASSLSEIYLYVGIAFLYAVCYSTFALAAGMYLFHSRELGGAEG